LMGFFPHFLQNNWAIIIKLSVLTALKNASLLTSSESESQGKRRNRSRQKTCHKGYVFLGQKDALWRKLNYFICWKTWKSLCSFVVVYMNSQVFFLFQFSHLLFPYFFFFEKKISLYYFLNFIFQSF
jgi:hypothetical protein